MRKVETVWCVGGCHTYYQVISLLVDGVRIKNKPKIDCVRIAENGNAICACGWLCLHLYTTRNHSGVFIIYQPRKESMATASAAYQNLRIVEFVDQNDYRWYYVQKKFFVFWLLFLNREGFSSLESAKESIHYYLAKHQLEYTY